MEDQSFQSPLNSKRTFERLNTVSTDFSDKSPLPQKFLHTEARSVVQNFIDRLDEVVGEEKHVEDEVLELPDLQIEQQENPIHLSDVYNMEDLLETSHYQATDIEKINLDSKSTNSLFLLHHLTQKKVPALLGGTAYAYLEIFGKKAPLLSWLCLLSPQPLKDLDSHMEKVGGKPVGTAIFSDNMMWTHMIRLKLSGPEPQHLDQDFSEFIDYLSSFDYKTTSPEEQTCLELNGCLTNGITSLHKLPENSINKLFPPPYIQAMSRQDKRLHSAGITYNLGWSTEEPVEYKKIHGAHEKLKKDRRSVETCYGLPYNGDYHNLVNIPCLAPSELSITREIYVKKALLRFLKHKGLTMEDLMVLNIEVTLLSSAHPFFFIQEVLLGNVPSQTVSIRSSMGKSYTNTLSRDIIQPNEEPVTMSCVLKHLTMILLSYSDTWKAQKERILKFFSQNHSSDRKRQESLKVDLSKIPEFQFPCKDIDALEKNMLDPLLKLLYKKEIQTHEAMEYLCELAMGPKSSLSCSRLPLIAERLEKARTIFERYSPQHGIIRRRKKLAHFLTNYQVHDEDVSKKIEQVQGMGEFDEMVKAVIDYLLMTLGYDFCKHMLKIVLQYDENTCTSKVRGIFIRGDPSSGKTQALKIILRIFENRFILNDKRTTESQGDITLDGIIKCKCDFLVLDEFEAKKFSKPDTMKQSSFNNCFDLSKDSILIDVKHKQLMIMNKPIPILASHYLVDSFLKVYDNSFFSRFGPKIDMDELIQRLPKEQWPERKAEESLEIYKEKLVEEGYADYKPVFPLRVEDGDIIDEEQEMRMGKELLKKYGISEKVIESESVDRMNHRTRSHRTLLMRNRLTKNCAKFPTLNIDQAAYVFWTALVKVWDDIWALMKDSEKEILFPLQSCRATKKENITTDGLKYSHQDFSEQTLKPSLILGYPDDLENPQRLAQKLKFLAL